MDGVTVEQETAVPVRTCDVLVIGGGPGGAATATHLVRRGYDVVIAEKDRHPRFHVGESLLPGSMTHLKELGVLDRVREIGVWKGGATFVSEDGTREQAFQFRRALLPWPKHAYQVRRDEFDQILFEHAVETGATAYQETTATIRELDRRGATIRLREADGTETDWRARMLVDASGRSALASKLRREQRPDPNNTSAAIFGHFRGVPRSEDKIGGNIRIHLTRPGWMWQIPLRDGVTSIGFVAPGAHMAARNTTIEAFFEAHCAQHLHLAEMLATAERIGPLHATGNFSYRARRAAGPGHIKVGDAYGFIDPVFSTGVHLALTSAREAADAISDSLEKPSRRTARLARYHTKIERRLGYVSWFIYRIHDPVFRHLMLHPRNLFGIEQAVVSLLAGDFRPDPRLRLRIALFKLIRYIHEKRPQLWQSARAG